MIDFTKEPVRAYPKSEQVRKKRIKPTQRQMGAISPKVRQEVRERSGGRCEVLKQCNGAIAYEMAHITGRKQLNRVTKADDLLHACVECHRWLDTSADGIAFKKQLRGLA